jgi:nitric oxide reductase NorD protein
MKLLDLMEPEETIGNLWHDMAHGMGGDAVHAGAAVTLAQVRPSLAVLFRALGGDAGVEMAETAATLTRHRRSLQRKLGAEREKEYIASFDGARLRLPPFIAVYADPKLNRATYFWLVALAAFAKVPQATANPHTDTAQIADSAQITANAAAADLVHAACPGLRTAYAEMRAQTLHARATLHLPAPEAAMEQAVRDHLNGTPTAPPNVAQNRSYMPFAPVPFWLRFTNNTAGAGADHAPDAAEPPPPTAATTTRKLGERRDRDEANRKDSFILHRFESILSWVESMNLNRSVDDDDAENAQKAADDQDNITLSKVNKRAATRLRLHLDLSPTDADTEALAGKFTYPEWNHRSRSYMADHTRVLDAPAVPDPDETFIPNAARAREVRRQFETLRPRRILQPRQIDGSDLDLDALITAQADLRATGTGSDRIWHAARQIERDLAVAFLIDTSRSTEAAVGDTCVIDVAREALAALAKGIDAAGDSLGIWGFSSLRRDRVFLTRCKGFDDKMGPAITANICALRPGHYTRLGAAIRHTSAMLALQPAARKLLIVLTDGKPNDLDHYEGHHGVEDSRMAVREARRAGQSLHGVIIDEDGQDWFARIFGRGGFSLMSNPERLPRALPDIYRTLTTES